MKSKKRDYLTISMAMFAVLLCGYGLGHLVGEKKGLQTQAASDPDLELSDNWAAQTISRVEQQLNLNPEQRKSAQEELLPFSRALDKELRQLRTSRTRYLLEFHENLKPHLDHRQKAELEVLQNKLNQTR